MSESAHPAIAQRRTILLVLLVPAVALIVFVSTLFLGSTAGQVPTGKVAGVEAAVTADVALQGVSPSHVLVTATISATHRYWAEFTVSPRPGYDLVAVYGYAHFEVDGLHREWQVVASGTRRVGCAGAHRVPADVIVSFAPHRGC